MGWIHTFYLLDNKLESLGHVVRGNIPHPVTQYSHDQEENSHAH